MNDVNPKYDPAYEDMTPKADLCSEIPCAEYRDRLECRVQALEAKVRETNLQNQKLQKVVDATLEYVRYIPGSDKSADAAFALIAAVNAFTEKRREESECDCMIPYLEGAGQHSPKCAIFKKA